jgi:hypothetical protein
VERRQRVFETRVLGRIFLPKRGEGSGEDYITTSFMLCILTKYHSVK